MFLSDDKPLVSVITLVYNHEPFLHDYFNGILIQKTDFKFEVIIHDDASTDNSAKIIKEYVDKYPDIFIPIFQTENQYSRGVKIGESFLYPKAKGKYIALCEGDDYWIDPLKLQKEADLLEKNSDCTMVYTNFNVVDQHSVPIHSLFHEKCIHKSRSGLLWEDLLVNSAFLMTLTTMCRIELVECAPLYSFDYGLFLKASRLGKVIFLNEKTSNYRVHLNSVTHSRNVSILRGKGDIIRLSEIYCALNGVVNNEYLESASFYKSIGYCVFRGIVKSTKKFEYLKLLFMYPKLIIHILMLMFVKVFRGGDFSASVNDCKNK